MYMYKLGHFRKEVINFCYGWSALFIACPGPVLRLDVTTRNAVSFIRMMVLIDSYLQSAG